MYEYYKVKNAARKQKEEEIKNGLREKSRSPSPIVMAKPVLKKVNKRCYRLVILNFQHPTYIFNNYKFFIF